MFLKSSIRNFLRHKGFSTLNLMGLTIGLTACIMISLFVWDEQQFDKKIPDKENIYRIYVNRITEQANENVAMAPPIFTPTLKEQYPEVEYVSRFLKLNDKALAEYNNKHIYQGGGILTDSSFFDIFPLKFRYGSHRGALNDPSTTLISEEFSYKLFGDQDPVGKFLHINKDTFEIKGVYQNDPRFHLQIGYMLPMQQLTDQIPAERMRSWGWMQFNTYMKVKKGTYVKSLQSKFQALTKKEGEAFAINEKYGIVPYFQPLEKVHLHSSDFKHDMAIRGNKVYVNALTIIAIFILLIACFNFVNLATAKSIQRAREIGVRKTMGAKRTQLMFQFIGETTLLTFFGIILSVVISFILLPSLNSFTDKQMSFPVFSEPSVIPLLLIFTALVGLIAGFYPAMILSGFRAVEVLKTQVATKDHIGLVSVLRKGLVVIQFTISVGLIISALIVYRQVNYLHNKDLGFNKEEIMFFQMRSDEMFRDHESFKSELLKLPGVVNVSMGYGFPGDQTAGDQIIVRSNGGEKKMPSAQLLVDHDYIKTLGLSLVAGRDFSREIQTDADHAFIINETAVKEMGFGSPQNAIGQTLHWPVWESQQKDSLKKGQVIGVVRDFHFKSLYDRLETTVIHIYPPAYWKVAVKFNTNDVKGTISRVEKAWHKFSPFHPMEYIFLDDNFSKMYKSEDKLRSLLLIFTVMAIFVGCLGLFGLAAYAAERRKKEIGIRKILGASVEGLVLLLSKDFVKLVLLSLLIATPLAWVAMDKWLQEFPYRININWWVFALAGIITLAVAMITVSFQAIKAAVSNPVNNLRTE